MFEFSYRVWPGVALVLDEVLASRAVSPVAHAETDLTKRASLHSSKSLLRRRSVAM